MSTEEIKEQRAKRIHSLGVMMNRSYRRKNLESANAYRKEMFMLKREKAMEDLEYIDNELAKLK